MRQQRMSTETALRRWCLLANKAAFDIEGRRETCILTSCALAAFLQRQGLDAQVFRAVAKVFPTNGFSGATAGTDGDGWMTRARDCEAGPRRSRTSPQV
jgi:hypothetical protein